MRLPRRFRQHWKWVAGLSSSSLWWRWCSARLGSGPTSPGTFRHLPAAQDHGEHHRHGRSVRPQVPHELSIELTDAELSAICVRQFEADGDKKWVTADITIDGTVIERRRGPAQGQLDADGDCAASTSAQAGRGPRGGGPLRFGRRRVCSRSVSADDPTVTAAVDQLRRERRRTWLPGADRVVGASRCTSVLNEAMALSLTAQTGQPTQRYAYVTYSINGDTTTRLVLEHPDDTYADELVRVRTVICTRPGPKSKLEYRGPDQSVYAEQFKQINAVDTGNLQPLINFLKWLDTADDERVRPLAAALGGRRIAGALRRDAESVGQRRRHVRPGPELLPLVRPRQLEKLSVLSWDLNLAMLMGDPRPGRTTSWS